MKNVMVVNMGLKSIRCIIFNQNGLKLGSAAKAINTAINDKCVEQDPDEWWEKGILVVRKALSDAGCPQINYITVTTSASCLVCVDKYGNPLQKAFMISDKRADSEAIEIKNMPEFGPVLEKTRLDMASSLMLPKIYWVKKHMPETFEKTQYFMSPNDFLLYKLTGKCVTDYLNAVKYHYDTDNKCYPEILLKKINIDIKKLPEVVEIGESIGNIRKDMAEIFGLTTETEVVASSYDAICSFIGSGVSEEGESSDVSGTVTVFRTLTRKKAAKTKKVYNIPYYSENANIIGGSNNLGGGLIEWVKQCYYLKDEYPYEIMEKEASESELGARGLLFLPYLLGERTPVWDDSARGVFFGLERMHTRKDMTRAVFESTGFIDLSIIDAINEAGIDVNSVRLSGGLARINLVSQIKADILGKDVLVLSEFETTSSGAAMIVLAGQNVYPDLKSVADKFAVIRMIIKPNKENNKKYQYMYELYKDAYNMMKPLFKRRMEIVERLNNYKEIQIENL